MIENKELCAHKNRSFALHIWMQRMVFGVPTSVSILHSFARWSLDC